MSKPLNLDAISREWLRVADSAEVSELIVEKIHADDLLAAMVSAARAWRDGRRDRVAGAIYHQQCLALYAAVNALDEPAVPSVRRRVPTQAERIAAARADGHHRITEETDQCPASRQTGIAGMPETLTCNRGAGHDGQTHRDPVYGYWTHPARPPSHHHRGDPHR